MKLAIIFLCLTITASAQFTTRMTSTQPTIENWQFSYMPFDVNKEAHQDHVVRMGWNCSNGGGAEIIGQSAICFEFESHYRPGGPLDAREWKEIHLAGITRSGVMSRGMSFLFDENTGSWTTLLQSNNFNFLNGANANNLQIYDGLFIFQGGATIRSVDNNATFLGQYNAAGNRVVPIARVNTLDEVEIGNSVEKVKTGPLNVKDSIGINGVQVVSSPCAAIDNSEGDDDDRRAVNLILNCLRHHGLLLTN